MTRGRKKDLTIPPTRSLVQQRDYRARKAVYIASLEERCKKAEDENAELRKEISELRATLSNPAVLLPETAAASAELMQHLSLARDSLARFHGLAFPDGHQPSSSHTIPPPPFHMPTPPSSSHYSDSATPVSFSEVKGKSRETSQGFGRKQLYVEDSPPPISPTSQFASTPASQRAPSISDECCGGIFDCDELSCEEEDEEASGAIRTSDVRSTKSAGMRFIRRLDED
ncbi:hypothetical protein CPB83DRAFT_854326 [Crepidotus variabilis]|uniref:BZIP domain-containing protein n=1 Tax=Crepidotus variabilis TaxID=179855 RepID=A0A9P6EGN1_9AGAR|nr:hypothetical protein CPB83DRAFT_854326 [Crepidotus variabilis]